MPEQFLIKWRGHFGAYVGAAYSIKMPNPALQTTAFALRATARLNLVR